jgi:hypothetical protein
MIIHAGSINRDCKYHLVWVTKYRFRVWAEYIKNQTAPEPDDDFKVTWVRLESAGGGSIRL